MIDDVTDHYGLEREKRGDGLDNSVPSLLGVPLYASRTIHVRSVRTCRYIENPQRQLLLGRLRKQRNPLGK